MIRESGTSGAERSWPGWIPPARTARVALILGGALHLLFTLSLITHWLDPFFLEAVTAFGQAGDYFGIHQAGQNLLDGLSIYDCQNYRGEAVPEVPYYYFYRYLPPTAYVAALGAFLWDPWTGYWIWVAINEVLLLGLLVSLWRWPGVPTPVREALVGVTLGFAPFYLEQWMGQYSFVMTCCLWLVFRGEMTSATSPRVRDRNWIGPLREWALWAWVGSIALKSYTALFSLVFLLQGRWRRVFLAAALVCLAIVPYYAWRPEDVIEFARLNLKPLPPTLLPVRYGPVAVLQLVSHHLFADLSFTFDAGFKTIHPVQIPVYGWILLVFLVSSVVTLRNFRSARSEHLLILWLTSFFCVYKDIWEYHHLMLLPALFVYALGHRSRIPWLLLVWLALPSANVWAVEFWSETPMENWNALQVVIHHVFYALPVLVLHLWTIRRCWERN